jgi:hypothetical protein
MEGALGIQANVGLIRLRPPLGCVYAWPIDPRAGAMPTPTQLEKPAAAVGREPRTMRTLGPADAMPPEYRESVLNDPRARAGRSVHRALRLSGIPQHILRVSCSRCGRTVEIQKADAVRLLSDCSSRRRFPSPSMRRSTRSRRSSHPPSAISASYPPPWGKRTHPQKNNRMHSMRTAKR